MIGEIITEHRERMLNLKKYYPFFKLIDTSFSQFKEGRYEALFCVFLLRKITSRKRKLHTRSIRSSLIT